MPLRGVCIEGIVSPGIADGGQKFSLLYVISKKKKRHTFSNTSPKGGRSGAIYIDSNGFWQSAKYSHTAIVPKFATAVTDLHPRCEKVATSLYPIHGKSKAHGGIRRSQPQNKKYKKRPSPQRHAVDGKERHYIFTETVRYSTPSTER